MYGATWKSLACLGAVVVCLGCVGGVLAQESRLVRPADRGHVPSDPGYASGKPSPVPSAPSAKPAPPVASEACVGALDCCGCCGRRAPCQRKVCQVVCEVKKEKRSCWCVQTEEFCAPLPACPGHGCQGCGGTCDGQHGTGDCAQGGCQQCPRPPHCGPVRTRKILVKQEYEVEVPVYKCVVWYLCASCCESVAAQAAPTPAPAGSASRSQGSVPPVCGVVLAPGAVTPAPGVPAPAPGARAPTASARTYMPPPPLRIPLEVPGDPTPPLTATRPRTSIALPPVPPGADLPIDVSPLTTH